MMIGRYVIKKDMIGKQYEYCTSKECRNLYNTEYKKTTGYCKPCEDRRKKNDNK